MADSQQWERSEQGFERLREIILSGQWPLIRTVKLNAMAALNDAGEYQYVLSFAGPDAVHEDRTNDMVTALMSREQAETVVEQLQAAMAAQDHYETTGEATVVTRGGVLHG